MSNDKSAAKKWLDGLRRADREDQRANELRSHKLGSLATGGRAGLAPKIVSYDPEFFSGDKNHEQEDDQ